LETNDKNPVLNNAYSKDRKVRVEDDLSGEVPKVEVKEEPKQQPMRKAGRSGKVLVIKADKILVEDSQGNGISLPLEPEYKNAKIGEVVYF